MKILIEGTDFTGKTTLAKSLATSLRALYVHPPIGMTAASYECYQKIKNSKTEQDKKFWFLRSNMINGNDIERISKNNRVVIDRSVFSMFAYQFRDYSYDEFNTLLNMMEVPNLVYDHVICLYCDEETLRKRYEERYDDDMDDMDSYFLENLKSINDFYIYNFGAMNAATDHSERRWGIGRRIISMQQELGRPLEGAHDTEEKFIRNFPSSKNGHLMINTSDKSEIEVLKEAEEWITENA